MKKYIYENVEILEVVDGDTIDVLIDLGFSLFRKERLRLYGINTPETRGEEKEQGLRSKEYVKSLLPKGSIIKLESLGDDKYGRCLANIYKDDLFINKHLLEEGYAREYLL